MKNHLVFALVCGLVAASNALAADYTVDPSHSNVGFTVKHLTSKVSGAFTAFDGSFTFDEKKPDASKVNFTIQAKSIDTNNDDRDKHLRSDDFFAVDKNPTLTFVSKEIKVTGKNKYDVKGDLTMRGVTKPVTFKTEYMGAVKDPWGNDKAGFVAAAEVNRKDFGIVWNKALDKGGFVLGDTVTIGVQIEAGQKKAEEKKQASN